MSSTSSIEWTDATWNPVRGCTKISPGCKHCYAETFAERWRGIPGHPYEQGFDLRLVFDKISEPLTWAKPRRIFANSMSDLLHKDVPPHFIELVAQVMRLASWHEFQVLTKRAERLEVLSHKLTRWHDTEPRSVGALDLANVIVGVSVENRKHGMRRIEHLRRANVRKRFLSIEPLLEDLGDLDLTAIDWVIVGGESGLGARPLDVAWVRKIRDQCTEQHVAFFFKQWGGVRKKKHGRELDGRTHDDLPMLERGPVPKLAARQKLVRGVDLDVLDDWRRHRALEHLAAGLLGAGVHEVRHRIRQLSADGIYKSDEGIEQIMLDGWVDGQGRVRVEGDDTDEEDAA